MFYITTPIYYVNDQPHIGHAYTTLLADVLSRAHRLLGDNVYFLTGTDEHGQKVQEAAQKRGVEPQAHCDEYVKRFETLWERLQITHQDFIRTTEPRHKEVVQEVIQALHEKGDIYLGEYVGWYCVPCEQYWTSKDLLEGNCPECKRSVNEMKEPNYFFKMDRSRDWLKQQIEENPEWIVPESRKNEVLGILKEDLGDLCISRPKERLSWGVPLPFDPDYVTYVWFDALLNYITAIGYRRDDDSFQEKWPAVHLIGKDIIKPHCIFWPIMLKEMGVPLPKKIVAHGWWMSNDEKMSKSTGNVVNPMELLDAYGLDAFRYYVMREMNVGQDADFSLDGFRMRYEADLANDLGNLLSRVVSMIGKYRDGVVPSGGAGGPEDGEVVNSLENLPREFETEIHAVRPNRALEGILARVVLGNRLIEEVKPWALAKDESQSARLDCVLHLLAKLLADVSVYVSPIMPDAAAEMRKQLGLSTEPKHPAADEVGGLKVDKGEPLFPKDRSI